VGQPIHLSYKIPFYISIACSNLQHRAAFVFLHYLGDEARGHHQLDVGCSLYITQLGEQLFIPAIAVRELIKGINNKKYFGVVGNNEAKCFADFLG